MSLALVFAFAVATVLALIAVQWLASTWKRPHPKVIDVEDYYDENCMGTVEILSGRKHVFPIGLVQQIDIGTEPHQSPGKVIVYVTAEFHYAEFQFSDTQYEAFVSTIEQALPAFEAEQAKERGRHAIASNEGATIYISPNYPDAGIFPKFRDHRA